MRLIKRYKNRRLYDTDTKSAVTLSDIASLIRDEKEFKVIESETGEDITGTTVIQVLLNVEKRARKLGTMVASIGKATGKRTEELVGLLIEHIRSMLNVMDRNRDSKTVNSKQ
jgi:polyhydroxyalkanoate synthesis repressor PhaR